MLPYRKANLWGYIDIKNGNFIEPQYHKAFPFEGEFARVCINEDYIFPNKVKGVIRSEVWGVINKIGEFVIEPQFYHLESFSNGIAKAIRYNQYDYCGNQYNLINAKGEFIPKVKSCNQVKLFSNGFWIIESGNSPVGKDYCYYLFYVLDINGNKVLDILNFGISSWPKNILFSDFENGILKAEAWGKTYFFDQKGSLLFIFDIPLKDISVNNEGVFQYRKDGKYGLVNIYNQTVVKPIYDEIVDENLVKTDIFFCTSS